MTIFWTKSLRTLCLGLLVMLAGNVALAGCGGLGQPADVEEAENIKGGENQGDDDEGDRQRQNPSSKKNGDEDKDDDD